MFDLLVFGGIILVLLALIRFLPEPPSVNPEGRAHIIDGDSIVVQGVEIRLLGIDAPELGQRCRKQGTSWACGAESSHRLRSFTRDKKLKCTGNRYDQHDRLLAVCHLDGREINRWMVEQGWAVSFDGYPGPERTARKAGSGIWASDFERPREWRKRHQR